MAKTDFQSVDEYIASQPKESQRVLRRVRTILRGALPKSAEESISYQIPTYKIDGRAVIYFAGWKTHYSLYPLGEHVTTTLAKELAPYEVAKGTVRFPLAERTPTHLIQRIAKLRAEASAGEAAKRKPKAKAQVSVKKAVAKKVAARKPAGTKIPVKRAK